jgi:glycerate kinase
VSAVPGDVPLRVVIAPDSFKGTVSARDAARALAEGWRSVRPDDELLPFPMADGGEGTLDAFETAVAGSVRMPVTVQGPDNRPVAASWLLLPSGAETFADAASLSELAGSPAAAMAEAESWLRAAGARLAGGAR